MLSAVHRTALRSLGPLASALVIPVWMMAACTSQEGGDSGGAGGDTATGGDGGGEPNPAPDDVDVPLPVGGAGGGGGTAGSAAQAGMGGAVVPGTPGTGGNGPWSILPARSQGCGKAAQGTGSYVRKDMQIAGKSRANFVWLPANYDPQKAYPLLFSMHGTGGVAPGNGRGIETAAGKDAIIMTPQGIAGVWQLGAQGEDVTFFDAMYADAANSFCVNQQRVFVTGFSRGGAMSNLLGCVRGDKIRAIGPLAGWQPAPQTGCLGRPAAWFAHATEDGAVPLPQGTKSRDLHNLRNGCAATASAVAPFPCVAQDQCQPGSAVVWCPIPGDHGAPIEWSVPALWDFFAKL